MLLVHMPSFVELVSNSWFYGTDKLRDLKT